MLVLLGLYPTVMVLSRFLGSALDRLGAAPWLTLFISNVTSVVLLQWVLVPGSRGRSGAGWTHSRAQERRPA
jgi:antibiotic biosynthesis monooxygenase (ABM) superfamily enzyme